MAYLGQGEKLMLLVKRDERSTEAIAEAMGVDKSYLPKLYKKDVLPAKPLRRALAVFGVPETYFTEEESTGALVSEPDAPYHTTDLKRLQEEIAALREEIARLNRLLEQEKATSAKLAEAIVNMSKKP